MPLVTLTRATQNPRLAKLNATAPDYVTSLLAAASDAVIAICLRQFGPGSYTEYHDGTGYPGQLLQLDQYPVTAITRVATRPVPALRVLSNSPAVQRATVATTATGLTLTTVASGVSATATLNYADCPTLLSLATAVTALGNGWTAAADATYTLYASADLRPLSGAFPATGPGTALELYVEDVHPVPWDAGYSDLPSVGYRLDPTTGQLWGYFHQGRQNLRVDYTAGDAAVPDDIQQATVRLAAMLADRDARDSTVIREQVGPYQVYLQDRMNELINDPSVWGLLAPHRDISKLVV